MVVLQRRRLNLISYLPHRTTVIRSSYDIIQVAWPLHHSYIQQNVTFSPRNHSEAVCHRTTIVRLTYDVVRFTYDSASHQAIIVKSYVIVRLSFDCIMMSYDFTDITDASQTHCFEWPQNYDCDIVADVVAGCDQCFSKLELYDIKMSIHLQPCINIYKICYKL